MQYKRKPNNNPFYYKCAFFTIVGLIILYFIVYWAFAGNGFIETGIGLDKKDWLAFLGAYLSFAGTISITLVVILQNKYFRDSTIQQAEYERKKKIQPDFSVKILSKDKQISGTAEVVNPSTFPKHENIVFEIENVNEYALHNVCVFEKYICQLLKPHEKKQITVAYSNSPDAEKWKNHLIILSESEHDRTESGYPKDFNIVYDDIDGNEMYQTFEYKTFDDIVYYSLEGTHDI